jgi:hypothetical protein
LKIGVGRHVWYDSDGGKVRSHSSTLIGGFCGFGGTGVFQSCITAGPSSKAHRLRAM